MKSLLLFGATGDLARRMLMPSLYGLDSDGLLPDDLRIVGTARSLLSEDAFKAMIETALGEFVEKDRQRPEWIAKFIARLRYVPLDVSDPTQYQALHDALSREDGGHGPADGLRIFLSTAPSLFGPTIAGLKSAGLCGDQTRLALEKPLGRRKISVSERFDGAAKIISRIAHNLFSSIFVRQLCDWTSQNKYNYSSMTGRKITVFAPCDPAISGYTRSAAGAGSRTSSRSYRTRA